MKVKQIQLATLALLSLILLMTGCSTQKYSFEIDAPPQYQSDAVFKKMVVKPFDSNQSSYGKALATSIQNRIAKEGYIRVMRKKGDCILSGNLNVGKMYTNTNTERHRCTRYSNGKKYETTCYSYEYSKKIFITADYSLAKATNASMVYGDSITFDFDQSWSSGDSMSEARAKALTDEQIIGQAIDELTTKIVSAISPHKETVTVDLQKGSSDNVALGITYLEHGRIEQAVSIWDQCIINEPLPENKAASYYNIGVIKESRKQYRDAFTLYSKANTLLPAEELYIEAMTRTEHLNKQCAKLRKWNKSK